MPCQRPGLTLTPFDLAVKAPDNHRMKCGEKTYIWQQSNWPFWTYNLTQLAPLLAQVNQAQGRLQGRMHNLGMQAREHANLQILTQDVIKSSEIEGENLNAEQVRSSLARRLGLEIGALAPSDRHVDGVVDMVLDATQNHDKPLTKKRLFGWHAALFPTGYSGLNKIRVANWRDDSNGAMQVVSGPLHRQKIHYEAPPAAWVNAEMSDFLNWLKEDKYDDAALKAGIAHLWFVTIHPFDDGNGRIARAVSDMALARAESSSQRFYSMSAQIQLERKTYYTMLEQTQKGNMDITNWLEWFLGCMLRAIEGAEQTLQRLLYKSEFWQRWAGTSMNPRQIKLLNRLLDGFEGKLNTSKWASIGKCSADTALRDIQELMQHGILEKVSAGRSTTYIITKNSDQARRVNPAL